jgi:hypothetical protein
MSEAEANPAAEERAAIELLAEAKRRRLLSKRVDVPDQDARPRRRPAVEQENTIEKALAELTGKDASSTWVTFSNLKEKQT